MILMLENIIARGLKGKEQRDFCDEWTNINKTLMDFDMKWWLARHYMAQKNWADRLLSSLKGYPFVIPRTPAEDKKIGRSMIGILDAVTRYSIGLLDESFGFPRKKTKTKSREQYIKEIRDLMAQFDKATKAAFRHAKKDFQKYITASKEDYTFWLRDNLVKLGEYGLLDSNNWN
jgi:hypothetical protein